MHAYFEVGRLIVEDEQHGEARAGYGEEILMSLSRKLISEFGKGFSVRNLRNMRTFFIGRGKSKHRPRDDPSLYGGKYPFI